MLNEYLQFYACAPSSSTPVIHNVLQSSEVLHLTASVPLEIPQWQAKMALFAGEGAALNAYGAIFVQSEQNNIKIYPMNATEDAKLRNFVLDCQWLPTLSANLSQ